MRRVEIEMNPNPIVRFLGIPPEEFTKKSLIRFIESNNIRMLNFRYIAEDSRLKTLNFVITSKSHLDRILSQGERIDGSSVFSYIDTRASDLYIIPRYKTAFVNRFSSIPAVDILCAFYTKDGEPLKTAPQTILQNACESLQKSIGLTLDGLGELEYYTISDEASLYPVQPQKGYQESSPFCRWEDLRREAMLLIAEAGGKIKYGHSEVGYIHEDGKIMEQNEIEFLPVPAMEAADQIILAKWVLRMLGQKYGVTITFSPKISVGHAGSGLHIHTKLLKNGKSVMTEKGKLSDTAKRAIAGYLSLAGSLTAFGNTVPSSYLRLVPHQEAPTKICWSDMNRSALVRVPLGWLGVGDMAKDANPQEKDKPPKIEDLQTVEFRAPDGSANIHLLLAGLVVAARHGLEMKDGLKLADELYVDVNIFAEKKLQQKLPSLPTSCYESAERLSKDRRFYEQDGVFPPQIIDSTIKKLTSYGDRNIRKKLMNNPSSIKKLIATYLHCG